MTTTSTYRVQGMTCGHCVAAVTGALTELDGVRDVEVDLATGAVTVTAAHPLDDTAVRAAIAEGGYELTSP